MTLEADDTTLDTGALDDTSVDTHDVDSGATDAVVEPVVDTKPECMDDTIRAKFRELNEPVPAADAPVPEGKLRDPKSGRFVDKPKAIEPAKDDKAKPVAKVGADGKPAVQPVAKVDATGKPIVEPSAAAQP